jgi:nucleoside-diphosphate-sugar epimerase
MSKKILITGGCGFVGHQLTNSLLKNGHKVTVFDTQWFGNYLTEHTNLTIVQGDVRNTDAIPMNGMETIFHLANIANDPCSDLNSKLNWEVNVLATMQMVEKAISCQVEQFVFASSGSVYGVKDEPEVTEELSLVPISDYNKTKMISERVLLSYQDQIQVSCIRPATVCGYSPRMRLDLSVNMLTMQALQNKKITVFGGDQTRPNIHIQDLVRVYHHVLENPQELEGIFNAGFENISIMDIAKRAAKHADAEIAVTESNDPRSYRLSSKKLEATGFKQKYSVEDGILEVIEAYNNKGLRIEDHNFNIKTMLKLIEEGKISD